MNILKWKQTLIKERNTAETIKFLHKLMNKMMLNNLRRVIYQNWFLLKFNWLIEKLLFIRFIGLSVVKGLLNSLLVQILAGRKAS